MVCPQFLGKGVGLEFGRRCQSLSHRVGRRLVTGLNFFTFFSQGLKSLKSLSNAFEKVFPLISEKLGAFIQS